MFKYHLTLALRKMLRDKFYSFINIGGLAVGMAAFLLIAVYINHEMRYDRFHKKCGNIYRVYRIENEPSGKVSSANTPHALPKAMANDYPDLVNVVSIIMAQKMGIRSEDRVFQEKILVASPNFFDTFDFPFIMGSPSKLSENIQSILITKRLAEKLFGRDSPMGKTITVENQIELIVAGVIEDVPTTSSFQFDAFVSNDLVYKTMMPDEEAKWYSMGVETFVEFPPGLTPAALQARLPEFLKKYLPHYLQGRLGLGLQPLKDVHNDTRIVSYAFPAVSKSMLGLLFLVACAILGIASINFVNLATARYTERQKEIGIRKVVGADRPRLIQQFLGESILLTFCALIVGFALAQWMLPRFNGYVHRQLTFDFFKNGILLALTLGFGLLVGILNGLYPALLLSGHKPVSILKMERNKLFNRMHMRHILITLQFGVTIGLIFCVIIINGQIAFMKHHNLGFLSDNLIAIPTDTRPTENADRRKIELFTEILQNQGTGHGIISAAYSENVPGSYFPNQFSVIPEHGSNDDRIEMVVTRSLNEYFFRTYRMDIAQGRNFSKTFSTDANEGAVINETAAKMFGWKNPVGKRFRFAFSDQLFTVIGMIRDIHFRSLQNKIEPLVFIQCWGRPNFVTARIQSGKIRESLDFLKQEWQKVLPSFPFEYHFDEDLYRDSYKEEERILGIISTFSALAIGLASTGLLGLSVLIAAQRTKEIGIRKTLGASMSNIFLMLSKDFTGWIVLANVVAWPIAYYAMTKWLQYFAYRIDLTIWPFLLSGLLALLIALLTVGWQVIRAATANPVETLRYE
jgi:putative ABC transport system permease protein